MEVDYTSSRRLEWHLVVGRPLLPTRRAPAPLELAEVGIDRCRVIRQIGDRIRDAHLHAEGPLQSRMQTQRRVADRVATLEKKNEAPTAEILGDDARRNQKQGQSEKSSHHWFTFTLDILTPTRGLHAHHHLDLESGAERPAAFSNLAPRPNTYRGGGPIAL